MCDSLVEELFRRGHPSDWCLGRAANPCVNPMATINDAPTHPQSSSGVPLSPRLPYFSHLDEPALPTLIGTEDVLSLDHLEYTFNPGCWSNTGYANDDPSGDYSLTTPTHSTTPKTLSDIDAAILANSSQRKYVNGGAVLAASQGGLGVYGDIGSSPESRFMEYYRPPSPLLAPNTSPARSPGGFSASNGTKEHDSTMLLSKTHIGSWAIRAAAEKRRIHPHKFICPVCAHGFTSKANKERHHRAHFGIKSHECACGTSFTSKADLQRHRKSVGHTVRVHVAHV